MKNTIQYLSLIVIILLFASCQDKIEETYTVLEPEYLSYSELRSSFAVKSAEEIIQPGKIYFKGNHIFVNEYMKGIHIINNTDPSNPIVIQFIEIPGNVDLAIRENILYADSYVDLLAIDISNLAYIKEVKRIENAFPYMLPDADNGVPEQVDESKGVVSGWKEIEKTVELEPQTNDYLFYERFNSMEMLSSSSVRFDASVGNGSVGVGGSMARFTLYDKYMYAVDNSTLRLFDVSTAADPTLSHEEYIGWNIETIFPYDHKLFIGSQTGMIIFSLEDPSKPKYISDFWHASSCDPVVVEGDYAYVTLRAGNFCGDNESQLDVIDISNIESPRLIKEYAMEEPYGLGIDDSVLFVCDGNAGLKIYNASDPKAITANHIITYEDINAFDVIPLGEILLMIGIDGLFQYDYSDLENIQQLSHIPIYD